MTDIISVKREETKQYLLQLSQMKPHSSKINVLFSKPVQIQLSNKKLKLTDHYAFSSFFIASMNRFAYTNRLIANTGVLVTSEILDNLTYATIETKNREFIDFAEFSKKFDRRFISDFEVKKLWETNSCQTGKRYSKLDFKKTGIVMRNCIQSFLLQFKNIHEPTNFYRKSQFDKTTLKQTLCLYSYRTNGSGVAGRDITIEHHIERDYVMVSSEFPGCGNGSYYLLANEKELLHLEND